MDAERAWVMEPGDLDEPDEEEPEFWEDDELTPEELARLCASMPGEGVPAAGGILEAAGEGGVPDLVAAVLAASGDPVLMSDAELVGSLTGWHAVAARAQGRELRATTELLRRRRPRVWDRRADRAERRREDLEGAVPGGPGDPGGAAERVMPAVVASREAAAEIAMALTSTEYAAQVQAELAADLSRRLPVAFAELAAGRADLARIKVLAEAVQFLSDADAGRVDALLSPKLGQMTTGDLKARARQAVIRIDPQAAERRRARAERKARFALYGNDDQTATVAVEKMPAHLAAAAKARVNAIARAAKAAGMTGPLALLEAKVATGLLLDTLPFIPPPAGSGPAGDGGPGGEGDPAWDGPDGGGLGGDGPAGEDPSGPGGGTDRGGSFGRDPEDPGPAGEPWDYGWPAGWPAGPGGPADGGASEPGPQGSRQGDADPEFPGAGHAAADLDPEAADLDIEPLDADPDFADDDPGHGDAGFADSGSGTPDDARDHDSGESRSGMAWPRIPEQAGAAAPGCAGLPAWLRPKTAGRIRLTVPWRTLTGTGPEPGDLSWIGPVTPAQARDLATAAAADPNVTWRLIVTDDDGHAIALTTLRTRHGTGAETGTGTGSGVPGLVSEVTVTLQQTLAATLDADGKARDWITRALDRLTGGGVNIAGRDGWANVSGTNSGGTNSGAANAGQISPGGVSPGRVNLGEANVGALADLLARAIPAAKQAAAEAAARAAQDAAAGGCAHTMEAAGYRVPDRLRRWLNARDRTCRNPICRQPATRCDQDHTVAYQRGGRTCRCNLGGLCRVHHELKQLPGWHLSQDAQGNFTWTTPAGLTYRKEPHRYAI